VDEEQLNYLLRTGYIPSDKGLQMGDFGLNQNYLGKNMQGLESLGIGPNLNYLGDGTITGSIGVGPNQNYLGKGMNIGSIGQPRYDSGTQTIFPSNMSPALSELGGITPSYGVANETDDEQDQEYIDQVEESNNPLKGILSFINQFSPVQAITKGIGSFFDPKGSPNYRPATTGVFGYTPAQLNQMNALGGFYSEPMREMRRRSNRISNLLQRAAAKKNYSAKNLATLMKDFNMGDVDTQGMIDSIRSASNTGYGIGDVGGGDTGLGAGGGGRDYSSSPGAMAGDMEYGEE